MKHLYVIAAYRLSETNRTEEVDRQVDFVSMPSDLTKKDLPSGAVAYLHGAVQFARYWTSRQGAHQWLQRNLSTICHEQRFHFPTCALAFEVMRLPAWLLDPESKPPKSIPGMRLFAGSRSRT